MMNLDAVLQAIEEGPSPKEAFNASLLTKSAEKEMETPETPEDSDMAKVAEADAIGRIMARSYVDELAKLGVAPVAEYPADPGAITNNPNVEVGRGEFARKNEEVRSAAEALIAQLTAANKVGAGELATPAGVQPVGHTDPQEGNQPLAYDMAAEQERQVAPGGEVKTGAAKILTALYENYFTE